MCELNFVGSRNITTCGRKQKECYQGAKFDMESITGMGITCDCIPACYELVYLESKSFGGLLPVLNYSEKEDWNVTTSYITRNLAILHIFFPTGQFTKEVKAELYGFTEILSNVGGLLSLCMGFSFLSIIEMLYFVTVKMLCNWLLTNKKKKIRRNDDFQLYNSVGVTKFPFLK
ncbi:unnamed protein product [Phyllotreta striolata]|uniref:Uncharacterized protein n=1 Tax=Phyllotreta striolata TaxID=444603 RepID=A0A9N9TV39_PHYSR|nr:unnamed protein product [Phyllotreta striolata]